MKWEFEDYLCLSVWAIAMIANLAVWGTIFYVAWHFIAKYW